MENLRKMPSEAVSTLNKDTPKERLYEIATTSPSQEERTTAILWMTDASMLADVFRRGTVPGDLQAVLKNRHFSDRDLLEDAAMSSDNHTVRAIAMERLDDPKIYRSCILNDPCIQNKELAILKLAETHSVSDDDVELLKRANESVSSPGLQCATDIALKGTHTQISIRS